jgi:hypothetical protein
VKGILSQDEGLTDFSFEGWRGKNHFDACMFWESGQNINEKYGSLLTLDPSLSAYRFGELLHPVQDFYSHSNWVEIGKDRIVENGTGYYWTAFVGWQPLFSADDVLVVQGDLPDGWSMTSDVVPIITSPSFTGQKIGLFTHGREAIKLGDDCPSETQDWNHDQLNKDDPNPDKYAGDLSKYPGFHVKAKSLAVSQTAHEWCRLLSLLDLQGSSNAKKLFDAWAVDRFNALRGCSVSSFSNVVAPDVLDTNGDGVVDALDTNGDGIADSLDTNGDGIPDSNIPEPEPSSVPVDTDDDGVPDAIDTNGDGIPDSNIPQPGPSTDTSDSVPVDTNGDGIPDSSSGEPIQESSPGADGSNMGDTNGNGIPDSSSGIPQTLYQSQQYTCDPNSDNLQLNSKGDKVIELQTYLSDLGYGDLLGTGKIDGEFGANTQNSVMAYQRDFGIPSKGVVDLQTWFSLCEQVSSLPKTFSK